MSAKKDVGRLNSQQEHDSERQVFLDSMGKKTLRFWNGQLRRERQSVRDAIYGELQARAPKRPV